MCDVFNIRSHVLLLAGNLYALPSQGSMAFKLPSCGLLEHTKRSSAFNDFPQFSWSDLTDKEEISRGSFGCVCTVKRSDGESVIVKKLRQHKRETRLFLKEAGWFGVVWFLFGFISFGFISQSTVSHIKIATV